MGPDEEKPTTSAATAAVKEEERRRKKKNTRIVNACVYSICSPADLLRVRKVTAWTWIKTMAVLSETPRGWQTGPKWLSEWMKESGPYQWCSVAWRGCAKCCDSEQEDLPCQHVPARMIRPRKEEERKKDCWHRTKSQSGNNGTCLPFRRPDLPVQAADHRESEEAAGNYSG